MESVWISIHIPHLLLKFYLVTLGVHTLPNFKEKLFDVGWKFDFKAIYWRKALYNRRIYYPIQPSKVFAFSYCIRRAARVWLLIELLLRLILHFFDILRKEALHVRASLKLILLEKFADQNAQLSIVKADNGEVVEQCFVGHVKVKQLLLKFVLNRTVQLIFHLWLQSVFAHSKYTYSHSYTRKRG